MHNGITFIDSGARRISSAGVKPASFCWVLYLFSIPSHRKSLVRLGFCSPVSNTVSLLFTVSVSGN